MLPDERRRPPRQAAPDKIDCSTINIEIVPDSFTAGVAADRWSAHMLHVNRSKHCRVCGRISPDRLCPPCRQLDARNHDVGGAA